MLKKFIGCMNARERVQFFSQTVIGDWSDDELVIVSNILGLDINGTDKSYKYRVILDELLDRINKVA